MNSLSVQPYIGNDDYAALISCDEDCLQSEKIIRKTVLNGYRIWFDNSDLSEAEKINELKKNIDTCAVCMALMSNNAVNSHCFRSGLTYAVDSCKPVIIVFLDNAVLSVGMQIQAAVAVQIEKYKLSSEEFYSRLFDVKEIRKCKDTQAERITTAWLEREKNKDIIVLKTGATTFGRHETMCDYVINDNKYVGRVHATIINSDSKCVIIDNNSKNKTYVNSRVLAPEEQFRLYNGDVIAMASEKFIFRQS